jgi:glycerophosphoryl diester phosphodiesterase
VTHPFLDAPTPLAIAHRGGSLDGVENSLAAFRRAVELGYRYLETDVHATRDGVLVAFHDDELDRVTDRSGQIADLRWEEIRDARIGGREPIPLLSELLHALPDVRWSIDPKSDAAVEPLVRVLRDQASLERICIGSFDQRRLLRIRRALPAVATSAGPWEVRTLFFAARRALPRALVPRAAVCVQVPEAHEGRRIVDRRFVEAAHARGLPVHVWTVNEPVRMHWLLNLGVDGIVTDDLVALRDVLSERGRWAA